MLETSWRLLFNLLKAFEDLGSLYSAFFLVNQGAGIKESKSNGVTYQSAVQTSIFVICLSNLMKKYGFSLRRPNWSSEHRWGKASNFKGARAMKIWHIQVKPCCNGLNVRPVVNRSSQNGRASGSVHLENPPVLTSPKRCSASITGNFQHVVFGSSCAKFPLQLLLEQLMDVLQFCNLRNASAFLGTNH